MIKGMGCIEFCDEDDERLARIHVPVISEKMEDLKEDTKKTAAEIVQAYRNHYKKEKNKKYDMITNMCKKTVKIKMKLEIIHEDTDGEPSIMYIEFIEKKEGI